MNITQDRQVFSSGILRLVGYGLLVMALVDILFLLIPPQLMNPVWEFQTMGAIIERIPVTLLGIVLVYYGERSDRAPIERFILRWLSWLSLAAAILLFLMIPLSITDSFRIDYQQNAGVNAQVVSQIDTIQAFKDELKTANSVAEIGVILQKQANQKVNIPKSVNTQKLKTNIFKSLEENQANLRNQVRSFRSQKRSNLIKNCLKWNLGALVASILFFLIWKSTLWARLATDLED
jgi:competence protein ComGC